jgi:hypothetical protein
MNERNLLINKKRHENAIPILLMCLIISTLYVSLFFHGSVNNLRLDSHVPPSHESAWTANHGACRRMEKKAALNKLGEKLIINGREVLSLQTNADYSLCH